MALTTDGTVTWTAIKPLRLIGTVQSAINQHQFVADPLQLTAFGQPGNQATIQVRNNISAGTFIEFSDGVSSTYAAFDFDTLGTPTGINYILKVLSLGGLQYTVTQIAFNAIQIVNNSGFQGSIVKTGDITLPTAILITNFSGSSATDSSAGYLDGGTLTWISGNNAGVSMEIKTYVTNGSVVTSWLGFNYPPQPGDRFYYAPGCDKRRETCLQKFNNILNFRGEPDVPGLDLALGYPDAP